VTPSAPLKTTKVSFLFTLIYFLTPHEYYVRHASLTCRTRCELWAFVVRVKNGNDVNEFTVFEAVS